MNQNYSRVIPRDFFNEAKLLKCMGILALWELDKIVPELSITLKSHKSPKDGFEISLMDEGSLIVSNYWVFICDQLHLFKTTYNSKSDYPFYVMTEDLTDVPVIADDGKPHPEFLDYINSLKSN